MASGHTCQVCLGGFAISLPTLFEKSGAKGQYRRFKFEIAKIAERDELPGYALSIETADGREPSLRMRRRAPDEAKVVSVAARAPSPAAEPAITRVPHRPASTPRR